MCVHLDYIIELIIHVPIRRLQLKTATQKSENLLEKYCNKAHTQQKKQFIVYLSIARKSKNVEKHHNESILSSCHILPTNVQQLLY